MKYEKVVLQIAEQSEEVPKLSTHSPVSLDLHAASKQKTLTQIIVSGLVLLVPVLCRYYSAVIKVN
jgi:hypothetical protein